MPALACWRHQMKCKSGRRERLAADCRRPKGNLNADKINRVDLGVRCARARRQKAFVNAFSDLAEPNSSPKPATQAGMSVCTRAEAVSLQ